MTSRTFPSLFLSIALSLAGATTQAAVSKIKSGTATLPKPDVTWQSLNPARGNKSPQAGVFWGDIKGAEASGFLVKFKDGFASPPHIHNVSYRGIVISGQIHNDDPEAAKMWMPRGSFWTQPAGEPHITAAKGNDNLAYIEIDNSPYLVKQIENAFDNGERPVNIVPSNIIWLNASDVTWVSASNNDVKIAFLWGTPKDGELRGTFLKLPSGFSGMIQSNASEFRAVVIQGSLNHKSEAGITLSAGSYFGSYTPTKHFITAASDEDVIIYIRSNDTYELSTEEQS